MKVCVIDDSYSVRACVQVYLPYDDVDEMSCLPEDETSLAKYDAIIVDGEGIGNSKYRHGVEFCKAYEKKGNNKMVIFFSGLEPSDEDKPILKDKGVTWLTKGRDPQILADVVQGIKTNN